MGQYSLKSRSGSGLEPAAPLKSPTGVSKRIGYLDVAKGILIFFIINLHFPNYMLFTYGQTWPMIGFFLVSGILIFLKDEQRLSYREMLVKKVKALLYPYLTCCLMMMAVKAAYWTVAGRGISYIAEKTLLSLHNTVTFLGIGPMWFLSALFLGEVVFLLALKLLGSKRCMIVMFAVLVVSLAAAWYLTKIGFISTIPMLDENADPFTITTALIRGVLVSGFINLGYIAALVIKRYRVAERPAWMLAVCGAALIGLMILSSQFFDGDDLHFCLIMNPVSFFFMGIFGGAGILLLSMAIDRIRVVSRPVQWFGRGSIIIMATHTSLYIVTAAAAVVSRLTHLSADTQRIPFALLVYVLVVAAEIVVVAVVNRTPLKYIFRFPAKKAKV